MVSQRKSLALCCLASFALHLALLLAPSKFHPNKQEAYDRPAQLQVTFLQSSARLQYKRESKTITSAPPPLHAHSGQKAPTISGAEVALISNLDLYLPPSKLTGIPNPIDSIDLTLKQFRADGLLGYAELMLLINSDGELDAVLTIDSTLPTPIVDHAKALFLKARFTPGYVNKTPVRSRIRVELSLNPSVLPDDAGNPNSAKIRDKNDNRVYR